MTKTIAAAVLIAVCVLGAGAIVHGAASFSIQLRPEARALSLPE